MTVRELVRQAWSQTSAHELADPDVARRFTESLLGQVEGRDRPILVRRLAALARAWDIDLPLPQQLRPRVWPQPARRADWAPQAEQVFRLSELLDRRLEDRHGTSDLFAHLALASAILRGGLLRPEAWPVFCRLLQDGPRFSRAKHIGDLVWLDLALPRKPGRAAQEPDGETLRFFPDVVTLSLIARSKGARFPVELTPAWALKLALDSIGSSDPSITPETMRAAGFAALEDGSKDPIPAVLFEVARGALPAFSATAGIWRDTLQGTARAIARPPADTARAQVSARASKPSLDAAHSIRALTNAVHARAPDAHKQTRAPVVAALQRLLQSEPVPVVQALILWSLDLLARGRALGTVKRYAPTLARSLVGRLDAMDPAVMVPAQIEVLIEDALSLVPRAEQIYRAARIHQLFDFAANDPRLAWPQIELDIEGAAEPRIRTALIAPGQSARALQGLTEDPVHQIAFLLGARGGLRLSDMEALRIGDAEPGPDGMLCVHPTEWGSLKTSSARRMLPLAALLTPAELRLWNRFIEGRRAETPFLEVPLLAQGGGLLPLQRFERRAFATALAGVVGLRPHDLRHAAISNLALVLLAPARASQIQRALTGWGERQCADLRKRLVAKDPWRGINELSRLAGHRDPATTLERYIHICDLALGLHVQAAPTPRPVATITRQLGLNRRSVRSSKTTIVAEVLRPEVLDRLSVTEIRAAPPVAVPPPAASQVSVSLILQIETAIRTCKPAPMISAELAVPVRVVKGQMRRSRLETLKGLKDRQAAVDLAETVLKHPDARAWALQTQAARARGISFFAPLAAELWLSPVMGRLSFRADLQTDNPSRWGAWGRTPRVTLAPKGRRERLFLIPISPDGVPGLKLARLAAWMVLATLDAEISRIDSGALFDNPLQIGDERTTRQ